MKQISDFVVSVCLKMCDCHSLKKPIQLAKCDRSQRLPVQAASADHKTTGTAGSLNASAQL